MDAPEDKKKEALRALIGIVVLEAAIIVAVVAAWIVTGRLSYLIGGLIGSQIIIAPMVFNWTREKASHLKSPPGQGAAK